MGNEASTLALLRTMAAVEAGISMSPAQKSVQMEHAWDPEDCSDNMDVLQNGLLVRRKAGSGRTDVVRSRKGYLNGIHIWEIHWPKKERGSHAVVGVASSETPLTCTGYKSLIGSDDESVGWDIVRKVIIYNGMVMRSFPEDLPATYEIPEVIVVTLNMDEGCMYFKTEDRDFGRAVSGLHTIGKRLYPAISCVYGGTTIAVKYLGGSESVRGGGVAMATPLRFHDVCGQNVKLENDNTIAIRHNASENFNQGVVLTTRPLKNDEVFTVRLDEKVSRWDGSLKIGLTTNSPMELNFPATMTETTQGDTVMYSGNNLMHNGSKVKAMPFNLDDLEVGDKLSLMKSATGKVDFFVNDITKGGVTIGNLGDTKMFGVVDVYGKASKASVLVDPGSASIQITDGDVNQVDPDVILHDVETTIEMMTERDPLRIRTVHQAVKANLDRLYFRLGNSRFQQAIGDRLAEGDAAKTMKDYMKFLKRCGLEKQAVFECWHCILNVCANYADASVKFARALGSSGVVEDAIQLLRNAEVPKGALDDTLSSLFVMLHNCSKIPDNSHIYHKNDYCRIASEYVKQTSNPDIIISILFSMSHVAIERPDIGLLKVPVGIMADIVSKLNKTIESSEKHEDGWATDELLMGLDKLAKLEHNQSIMVDKNIVSILVKVMKKGSHSEKESAINLVWTLTTHKSHGAVLKTPGLKDTLEQLKSSPEEGVRQAAHRALVNFEKVKLTQEICGGAAKTGIRRRCDYMDRCRRFMATIGLSSSHQDLENDMCYCTECHSHRGDRPTYPRGQPPVTYALPVGWARFGIKPPPRTFAKDVDAFKRWHRAFHGTKKELVNGILNTGELLRPGDKGLAGKEIRPPSGHFKEDWKPAGFNIKQVFVSPSVRYAGHGAYATPCMYRDEVTKQDYMARVVLQVLIEPGSYQIGGHTTAETNRIDPNFNNTELEWSTDCRGVAIIYGLLVKLDTLTQ